MWVECRQAGFHGCGVGELGVSPPGLPVCLLSQKQAEKDEGCDMEAWRQKEQQLECRTHGVSVLPRWCIGVLDSFCGVLGGDP